MFVGCSLLLFLVKGFQAGNGTYWSVLSHKENLCLTAAAGQCQVGACFMQAVSIKGLLIVFGSTVVKLVLQWVLPLQSMTSSVDEDLNECSSLLREGR